MAALLTARFELRTETRDVGERALHELASAVRERAPDASFHAWREAGTTRYLALLGELDVEALRAIAPFVTGEIALARHELVTSSDLAPRRRRQR